MALITIIHIRNYGRERRIYKADAFQRIQSCILPLNAKAFMCSIKDEIQRYTSKEINVWLYCLKQFELHKMTKHDTSISFAFYLLH